MKMSTAKSRSAKAGTNRGAEPPAPLSSPAISAIVPRDLGDFGYAVGAAEIQSIFASRFADVRRRLPRHEIPFAVNALREEKARLLEALTTRCARKREGAAAVQRDRERLETQVVRRAAPPNRSLPMLTL